MVVPAGEGFDEARARGLGSSVYKTVGKGGTPILTFAGREAGSGDGADVDVSGNAITAGVSYQIYVLSVADGSNATVDRLSTPSNPVVLISNNP
ncbi:hypothetical protein D3C77_696610 [compost metagenome]